MPGDRCSAPTRQSRARRETARASARSSPRRRSIATTPARCTNAGEHDVLYSISLPRSGISAGRRDDPAEPPSGHQPRLRKAVGADDAIVAVGEIEERRRAQRASSRVSTAARRRRRRRSRCRAGGNARGSLPARRASIVQPVGLFGELIISARVPGVSASSSRSRSSVQPSAPNRSATQHDVGAEDLRNLDQVRPQRRDGDDAVAGSTQRLDGQHQRRHARRA